MVTPSGNVITTEAIVCGSSFLKQASIAPLVPLMVVLKEVDASGMVFFCRVPLVGIYPNKKIVARINKYIDVCISLKINNKMKLSNNDNV